jgi:hypothetical protein
LLAKKVIIMHVMGVKNIHEVLLEVSPLAMQMRPWGVKQRIGLTQHLRDLDMVVEWALRGQVTLINIVDKGGNIINLHSDNVKGMWLRILIPNCACNSHNSAMWLTFHFLDGIKDWNSLSDLMLELMFYSNETRNQYVLSHMIEFIENPF